jgi:hypothetical protein
MTPFKMSQAPASITPCPAIPSNPLVTLSGDVATGSTLEGRPREVCPGSRFRKLGGRTNPGRGCGFSFSQKATRYLGACAEHPRP